MVEEKGKLIKVTFEYEKEIHTMENKDMVQRWIDNINGMCVEMHARGRNPFDGFDHEHAWKIEVKNGNV